MTYDNGYAQFAPQPERPKRKAGKIIGLGCAGMLLLLAAIISVSAVVGGSGDSKPSPTSSTTSGTTPTASSTRGTRSVAPTTEIAKFQACVERKGSPQEKAVIRHVTKVQGADEITNVLDAPEVYTDLKGGLTGPDYGTGKLIASAFASCYTSDNGLVTVYDRNGALLATGTF